MFGRRDKNGPILLLLILLLTLEASGFGRPRSRKQQNNRKSAQKWDDCNSCASTKNSSSADEATAGPKSTDVDPHYDNCGLVGFGVVQKIHYQNAPHSGGISPVDVNFSSACVRCGICIVIADRINQSLLEAHDAMDSDQWLDAAEVPLFLQAICDHEFRHYALREISGERYIGDSYSVPGATPVASNADGQWESTLRNKCHDILDDAGAQQVYKHWRDACVEEAAATKPLVETLCRSADSARLRDCQNIDGDDGKKFSDAAAVDLCHQTFDWRARVKVTAELRAE